MNGTHASPVRSSTSVARRRPCGSQITPSRDANPTSTLSAIVPCIKIPPQLLLPRGGGSTLRATQAQIDAALAVLAGCLDASS